MGKKAVTIDLNPRIFDLMNREIRRNTLEKRLFERMGIILKASKGWNNVDIAAYFNFGTRKARYWRARWLESNDLTTQAHIDNEAVGSFTDKELLDRVTAVLSDAPRSGAPNKFTEAQSIRLQALACEKPETHGLPFETWTHVELSKQAKRMGIDISPSRLGILLKKQITAPQALVLAFSKN